MAPPQNLDKTYTRFAVTWQVNHAYPRRFKAWLSLEEARGFVSHLKECADTLELDWAEPAMILECIDEYYQGNCK